MRIIMACGSLGCATRVREDKNACTLSTLRYLTITIKRTSMTIRTIIVVILQFSFAFLATFPSRPLARSSWV